MAVFMLLLPSNGSMTCRVNLGGIMQKADGGHTEVRAVDSRHVIIHLSVHDIGKISKNDAG